MYAPKVWTSALHTRPAFPYLLLASPGSLLLQAESGLDEFRPTRLAKKPEANVEEIDSLRERVEFSSQCFVFAQIHGIRVE